jgi:hypothetical protein
MCGEGVVQDTREDPKKMFLAALSDRGPITFLDSCKMKLKSFDLRNGRKYKKDAHDCMKEHPKLSLIILTSDKCYRLQQNEK